MNSWKSNSLFQVKDSKLPSGHGMYRPSGVGNG